MHQKLKTQTNQVLKQSRQLANSNKQVEDEIFDLAKAFGVKEKKTNELAKQNQTETKEINEV